MLFRSAIKASTERPLSRLIYALGIRHVGEKTGRVLAQRFKTMDALAACGQEELSQTEDVGPIVAESIHTFFRQSEAADLMKRLKRHNLNMKEPEAPQASEDSPVAGKTFVFTGEMESMPRSVAEETVRALGGETPSSVSKKTSYVVVGKDPGSKAEKAKKLGVPMIDEAAFLKLIGR